MLMLRKGGKQKEITLVDFCLALFASLRACIYVYVYVYVPQNAMAQITPILPRITPLLYRGKSHNGGR